MPLMQPFDGVALIRTRGSYVETKLFTFEGRLYAAYGKGYIRLAPKARTSKGDVYWSVIESEEEKIAEVAGAIVFGSESGGYRLTAA